MKNVIKMFIATAVMGVMTVSAFAQGAGPGQGKAGGAAGAGQQGGKGQGGQRRGGMMSMDAEVLAKLNLTDGQKTKVKALKESTQKKVQELFKSMGGPGAAGAGAGKDKGAGKAGAGGAGGNFAGMREKMKPIMDAYQSGMKAILTPPQQAAYEKGVKEAREKMKAGRGGPGGPGGAAGKTGKGGKGTPPPTA